MSDAFWNNLPAALAALGTVITALGTLVAVILLHIRAMNKLEENSGKISAKVVENTQLTQATKDDLAKNTAVTVETKDKLSNGLSDSVEEIHKATNGMKDELIKATAALEFAKGITAGKLMAEIDEAKRARSALIDEAQRVRSGQKET